MDTNFWALLMVTCVVDGVLGGGSLIKVLVELPARKKMGAVEFAHYGRAADLGNGRYLYPLIGIGGAALTIISMIEGLLLNLQTQVMVPFYVAAGMAIIHTFTTTRAAPNMFKVGRAGESEEVLKPLLDRFTYWSNWRAIFQFGAFLVFLWAISAYTFTL
ncbi:MAG TPA: hypothetical protein VKK79_12415 [Candidatus Lokiarchaeia archaeon]|nr:hypothetical protein [Candidatus Lokiarchaeia archaeon]